MNKIFLWIVLAVIILGLLLILLNTRMGQSGDAPVPADNSVSAPVKPAPPVAQPPLPVTPGTPADGEKLAAARDAGAELVVIGRPKETGDGLEDVLAWLLAAECQKEE